MANAYKLVFFKSDVVGGEPSPNSTPPAAARIIPVPSEDNEAYTCMMHVLDGTSLVVTVWFLDSASALWIPLQTVTVAVNVPTTVDVPPAAQLFFQLGTNTGIVTKFGASFVSGDLQLGGASAPVQVTQPGSVPGATQYTTAAAAGGGTGLERLIQPTTAPCKLYWIGVHLDAAVVDAKFALIFDDAAVGNPAGAAVAKLVIPLVAGQTSSCDWDPSTPLVLSAGLKVTLSTTRTYTATASTAQAQYALEYGT